MNNRFILLLSNIFLLIFTWLLLSCIKPPNYETLYGIWQGESNGVIYVFEFLDENQCRLSFENIDTNSINILNGNFEIDFSKRPIPLTIRNIPQLNHPLHTIIELIDDDSIRIAIFASRSRLRPIAFEHDKSMYLKRVSNKSFDRNIE